MMMMMMMMMIIAIAMMIMGCNLAFVPPGLVELVCVCFLFVPFVEILHRLGCL